MSTHDALPPTYRVLGVKKEWQPEDLEDFFASQGCDVHANVGSLALEPDRQTKTATVTFEGNKLPPARSLSSEKLVVEKAFHGVTPLFTPSDEDHKIDLIAISGLGGHAFGSFKERGGEHMWLRDSLPEDLVWDETGNPMARIFVYGYSSRLEEGGNFQHIEDLATSFRESLKDCRLSKPIVLLGHSLGGLIIKEVLIQLSGSKISADLSLLRAIYGIVFFAVPHNGMDITSFIPMTGENNRNLLESLNRINSSVLTKQRREFPGTLGTEGNAEVFCFYETLPSKTAQEVKEHTGTWEMEGPLAVLVDKASATICRPWEDGPEHLCAIDSSHSEIVKFQLHDPKYKKVRGRILGLCVRGLEREQKREQPVTNEVSASTLDRRELLFKSLHFDQIDSRLSNVEHAHEDTCKWVISDPDFQYWQDPTKTIEHHGVLWIQGKPGAGKSTLMKVIYSHLLGQVQHDPSTLVASFFFSARGTELERTILGMYRSLLYQLMSRFPDLQAHFDNSKILSPIQKECSLVNIKDLLREAIYSLGSRSITCIIDALDECKEQEIRQMVLYFERLAKAAVQRGVSLRVCFSSRHYPTIKIRCGIQCVLENKPNHTVDMRSYAEDHLLVDDTDILGMILLKASGVFLWIVLVIEILNKEEDDGGWSLKLKIDQIPASLSELIREIIERNAVDQTSRKTLLLSLQWLLYARRPLTVLSYYHAMWSGLSLEEFEDIPAPDVTSAEAYEKAMRYVTSSSKGLAEVMEVGPRHDRQVQFIHESVRDFLIKEGGLAHIWPEVGPVSSVSSHERLKICCNVYWKLYAKDKLEAPKAFTNYTVKYPLINYIAENILDHADAAADGVSQEEFLAAFSMGPFIQIYWRNFREQPDLLSWLALFGHRNLIRTVLECIPSIIIHAKRRGWCRYPVLIALVRGHREAFKVLRNTASPAYTGANLLAEDITLPPVNRHPTFALLRLTPLTWAAGEGYGHIVQSLIHEGEDLNEKDLVGNTPFQTAVESRKEATIRILLDAGAKGNLGSALDNAIRRRGSEPGKEGHDDVIKLLIDREVIPTNTTH